MNTKDLQNILNNQPSVSGNTYFIFILWGISWLLFLGFLGLAIGLLLESIFHYKIFLDWVSRQLNFVLNEDQRWKISTSFGLISLFLSVVFLGFIFLCKMILSRNHHIILLEDWILDNVKEVKRKTIRKK